jgi:metallophosphoesterase (TIGR03767 family)
VTDHVEPVVSASEAPSRTTMGGTVVVGGRDPANGNYAILVPGPPEPHVIRQLDVDDFSEAAPPLTFALASFAQLTDLHIIDDQSPMRVEFLDRYADPGEPHQRSYDFDSAYRPHECLTPFLTDAICRRLRTVGYGPRTGLPLAFTMVSGDGIDNCQANELRWYIDILDGQTVTADSGSPTLDSSVTSDALGLPVEYWHPASRDFELSNHQGPGLDNYFRAGYPPIPQLPFIARMPFAATGLGMPWFACYGNHDALVQGNATPDGIIHGYSTTDVGLDLRAIAESDFKRTQITQPLPDVQPSGWDSDWVDLADAVVNAGFAGLLVPADVRRRLVSRAEFIAAHFDTHGTPVGHGFALGDIASYVVPGGSTDRVRHVVLDTTDPGGYDGGYIDVLQLQWLEDQLKAGSAHYLTDEAAPVLVEQDGVRDVLFVVHSHHAIRSLRVNSDALERLLLRYPNVVLMVNGHSHRNVIDRHFRPWPTAPHGGFYEVGTSAVVDFPSQGRLFELASGRGTVSIITTMVDLDAPLDFRGGDITQPAVLASLAREIAANDLQERDRNVIDNPGTHEQRNVRLVLPAPFPLPDPPVFGSPLAAAVVPGGSVVTAAADQQDQVRIGDVAGSDPLLLDGALRALCLTDEPDGTLHLFGVGADGVPWLRRRTAAGTWTPALALDGRFTAVAAAVDGQGRLELFAIQGLSPGSPDAQLGTLWHTRQAAAGSDDLEPWQLFADGGFIDVAACTDHSGRVLVVAVSASSNVVTIYQASPGDWSGATWLSLATPATAVTIGCGFDGLAQIVLTDDDGRLQSSRQPAAGTVGFGVFKDLDQQWARFTIRRLAMTAPAGVLHLYGADAAGRVFARSTTLANPAVWGAWAPLPMTVRPTLLLDDAPQVTWPGDQVTPLGAPVVLQLTAVGGVDPITWTADPLPPGLNCSTAGLISGVPVPGGPATRTVTVVATDANLAAGIATFTWTTVSRVPDVLGIPQSQAMTEIAAAGLTLGPVSRDSHCLGPAGIVVGQSVVGTTVVPQGTEIRISVSTGLTTKGKPCHTD